MGQRTFSPLYPKFQSILEEGVAVEYRAFGWAEGEAVLRKGPTNARVCYHHENDICKHAVYVVVSYYLYWLLSPCFSFPIQHYAPVENGSSSRALL